MTSSLTAPVPVDPRFDRSARWRADRFGMFIHWGAYAVPARGEWVRSYERIGLDDYRPAVEAFRPDPDFDAWAATAAAAGMKYAVLTAKHHDGYALFDSELSDYTTAAVLGRDLVSEFLAAFRARGIRLGLYFSLLDWARPDYPHFGDLHHPMRDAEEFRDHAPDLASYREFLHGQVREICSNYGKLDVLWFDFSYPGMGPQEWGAAELMSMVRELQPDAVLDNRLEGSGSDHGSLLTDAPTPWSGDFTSPEQVIPAAPIVDIHGSPVPWESCLTLNNHWGYCRSDTDWKSAPMLIHRLVECVSKGGNLLLNVGPDARGAIPVGSRRILARIGEWMEVNSASIRGCGPAGLGKPDWGWWTAGHQKLYAHVMEPPIGPLLLDGLDRDQVASVHLLADGSELPLVDSWTVVGGRSRAMVSFGPQPEWSYPLPDPIDTVLEVRLR
ncbi:alpha-L-fucosidase [Acidipropionibacterium virtanenii]|uniref:alpha-L-fucosidase n=1 Tax=Acidipropionibacterium virtanenii TaxID=2057246 RepID=A0A344UQ28_9ACTN|nr:alpha-L-fucosidase [Acidipropionibacterium virtanenii]AXE37376.1 hypothetical protein JS278_00179 [Acidipropionibacterium virtanenii]